MWQEVAQTLGRNKKRSAVTAFGVFWGIFMLIILLSVSSGFQNGIAKATQGVAANSGFIWSQTTSLPYAGFKAGRVWELGLRDLRIIQERVPGVQSVSGSARVWSWSNDNLSFEGKRSRATLSGITPGFFVGQPVRLVHGRMLNEVDHREARKYCLVGIKSAERLFGSDTSVGIGRVIKAGRSYYTVVGVVDNMSSGVTLGNQPSRSVYVPYQVINVAENKGGFLDDLQIVVHPGLKVADVISQVERVIRTEKQIAPDDKAAIGSFDISQFFTMFSGINTGINILVWIVGIGTLLTGVVGISNILLVTVRERTQEIGVRRALGAKPRDIISQLLLEAVSLATVAGLLGIVCGVAISSLFSGTQGSSDGEGMSIPFHNPSVDFAIVCIALAIIIVSGLIAGIIPAIKAIEVRAIEAIREE